MDSPELVPALVSEIDLTSVLKRSKWEQRLVPFSSLLCKANAAQCIKVKFQFSYVQLLTLIFTLLQPLKENRFVIPKSRYDSISTYLSSEGIKYSDIDLVYDKEIFQQLVDAG